VLLGDILVNLDGHEFEALEELHDVLLRKAVNEKIQAILIRGGKKVEVTVTLGERPLR
jgi:S1-C subfamily serine protease